MSEAAKRLIGQLYAFWLTAIACGIAAFAGALTWVNTAGGPGFDWIWLVAAFGLGAVIYNIAFFALCSLFLPGLANFVEDDTEVHGDDVTHVVRHIETGNENIDFYVRSYAAARGTTAVAIVSVVMAAVALYFF